jgi:signal transduction histidine kinase
MMVDSTEEQGAPRERGRDDVDARDASSRVPPAATALLAISDSGVLLSRDASFAELFSIPSRVISSGSTREVLEWLEREADDAGVQIAKVIDSEGNNSGEVRADDGRVIEWQRTRLEGNGGGSLFCFRDVSHERAAVQALRDAENWLHMFAAHTDGAVLELDASGRIVGTWSADAQILTVPEAALQGRTLGEALGEKYAAELERVIRRLIATGQAARLDYTVDTAEERKVFALDGTLLSSDTGGPAVVSVLVRDITEQTRMQTQLVQAERLASVGLLAAGVAHEINNPITYMVLNFHRVRRGIRRLGDGATTTEDITLAAELEQCIDMMVEGAQRVQEIVRDLQRFSRSDRHEVRELLDVRSVLEFTLGLVSFEVERHARVVREFGPVPLVLATDGRLSQVFLNLIRNAVQALPNADPARHEIRLVTLTDAAGNAVIEVRDTGVGISIGDMRKIFDPFYTTKPPNVGTGLGLAICHGITRSFGGEITADSHVGIGTIFRVVLPPARHAPASDAPPR